MKSKQYLIEDVDNGVIVTSWVYEDDDDKGNPIFSERKEVIEEEDLNKLMEKVMYWVAEQLGYQYNKYGEENLNISWDKKGHKIE